MIYIFRQYNPLIIDDIFDLGPIILYNLVFIRFGTVEVTVFHIFLVMDIIMDFGKPIIP